MGKIDFYVFYHIVLVTSLNKPLITDKIKSSLFDYLEIKSKSMNCAVCKLGGTNDHIHIAMSIPPNLPVGEVIENLKNSSENYIIKNIKDSGFSWKEGFYLATISPADLEKVEAYLDSQIIFHLKKSLDDEFKSFFIFNKKASHL
jgi:putative transposase